MIFVSKILSFTLVGLAGALLLQAGPDEPAPVEAAGQAGEATGRAVVNFSELAAREAAQPAVAAPRKVIHAPLRPNTTAAFAPTAAASAGKTGAGTPGLASPAPVINFLALPDDGTSIPPDTHGAVGPNHVMTVLNTQVRVQNRNGGVLTTVSLDGFWASVGGSPNCFDPKVLYDPYDNRWMFTACADGQATTAAVLMGVSQTSDPTGTWFLYRVDGDAANIDWVDYPSLGFNKNWIVVSINLFSIAADTFHGVNIYVFNKTNLYANGTGMFTKLTDLSGNASTIVPAITYDNGLTNLYLLDDWNGGLGQLRLSRLGGTPTTPTLTLGVSFPATTAWGGGFGNFLPQSGSSALIDGGDSRMQNVVYRNGKLWATHSVYPSSPNRAAVQWWQIRTNGPVLQVARIDDPTGQKHFSYPTLAVNANDDMLIGYSRFGSAQFASANYSFRLSTDAPNTLRDDTVLKAGEGAYFKTFGGGANRWGDYSSTVVDPVNDVSMWTIQEYAATPVGTPTSDGSGRWGTWWGRIDVSVESVALVSADLTAENCAPANGVLDPGETVTFLFTLRNSGGLIVSNLVATLQAGTGVSAPGGPQNYGALAVGGANVARSFTFVATGSCGGLVTTRLQLQDGGVNLGTLTNTFSLGSPRFAFTENFDGLSAPALPAGWTNFQSGGGAFWVTTNGVRDTLPNSIFAPDPGSISDQHITTPPFLVTTTNAQLTFRHQYDLENTYDGGVLEIALGAGAFTDIIAGGGLFLTNGYTTTISLPFGNPLAGRAAWSGFQASFISSTVRLPTTAAGQNVRLRWRTASDSSASGAGWYVDTVSVSDGTTCCVGVPAPVIQNVRRVGGNVAFSFASGAGQTYNVEYKGSLNVSNWITLQTIAGDGTLKNFTNTLTTTNRFFRLRTP